MRKWCARRKSWRTSSPRANGTRRASRNARRLPDGLFPRAVDAPRAGPGRGEVEEDEAVEDRAFAPVDDWPEAFRSMLHEISDRHLAGGNEGGEAREQSKRNQRASGDLDDGRSNQDRRQRIRHTGLRDRKMDQLGESMLHEQQGGHDPQQRAKLRLVFFEMAETHGNPLFKEFVSDI